MDLPSVSNAPREVSVCGSIHRGRAFTIGDYGEFLAWLDDRLPPECRPIRLGSEEAILARASQDGVAVVLHLCLLSCAPRLTRDEAIGMAATMNEDEIERLFDVAFYRRATLKIPDVPREELIDLALQDWGRTFEGLRQDRGMSYEQVARLSLDQYDNLATLGEADNPTASDVQAMWEAAMAEGGGDGAEANGSGGDDGHPEHD